jgi:hypothetical protein
MCWVYSLHYDFKVGDKLFIIDFFLSFLIKKWGGNEGERVHIY